MPRMLPWLAGNTKSAPKDASSPKAPTTSGPSLRPVKRQRLLEPNSDAPTLRPPTPRRPSSPHQRTSRSSRSPSTSPPPDPPAEEFMRDGLDADDIYKLVEDDFLATARLFTAHVHHAEYARLKRQAQSRKAGAAPERLRSVDGWPPASPQPKPTRGQTTERKKIEQAPRHQTSARAQKGSKANVELEDLWKGSELHGLLIGQSQAPQPAQLQPRTPPKTRAAAGFSRYDKTAEARRRTYDLEPRRAGSDKPIKEGVWTSKAPAKPGKDLAIGNSDDSDDSNDLDGPANRTVRRANTAESAATKLAATGGGQLQSGGTQSSLPRRRAVAFAHETGAKNSSALEKTREPDHGDVLVAFARPTPLPSGRSWAQKRQEAKEAEASKRKKLDEIPIFLV